MRFPPYTFFGQRTVFVYFIVTDDLGRAQAHQADDAARQKREPQRVAAVGQIKDRGVGTGDKGGADQRADVNARDGEWAADCLPE